MWKRPTTICRASAKSELLPSTMAYCAIRGNLWSTLKTNSTQSVFRFTASMQTKSGLPQVGPRSISEVNSLLQGNIVACHTAFDRVALLRACEKNNLAHCECRWLDSAMVVRRAWPIFSRAGYGLTNVAAEFGIKYRPHDALEDARCAGEILLRAIAETGLDINQWLERVKQPIHPAEKQPLDACVKQPIHSSTALPITRHGNPDGPLYGEVLVFTGALSMPRHEAADAAAGAGCEVATSVSKQTTLLVVGNQDVRKLAGQERSSKHRKAEELINQGQKIRIISESDFQRIAEQRIVRLNGPS